LVGHCPFHDEKSQSFTITRLAAAGRDHAAVMGRPHLRLGLAANERGASGGTAAAGGHNSRWGWAGDEGDVRDERLRERLLK